MYIRYYSYLIYPYIHNAFSGLLGLFQMPFVKFFIVISFLGFLRFLNLKFGCIGSGMIGWD